MQNQPIKSQALHTEFNKNEHLRSIEFFFIGSLTVVFVSCFILLSLYIERFSHLYVERKGHFLDLTDALVRAHQTSITQEFSFGAYESVANRLLQIAKQLESQNMQASFLSADGICLAHYRNISALSQSTMPSAARSTTNPSVTADVPPNCLSSRSATIGDISVRDKKQSLIQQDGTLLYLHLPMYLGSKPLGEIRAVFSDPVLLIDKRNPLSLVFTIGVPVVLILAFCIAWIAFARRKILQPYLMRTLESERDQAMARVAAQVAHDIQSPLSTLSTLVRTAESLPKEQRILLKTAASRIQSIADDLLKRWRNQLEHSVEKAGFAFIGGSIDSIVAEKSALIPADEHIDIRTQIDPELRGMGVPISSQKFQRMISNLINNALESFDHEPGILNKFIEIRASRINENVCIEIEDNGCGMAPNVLAEVRTVGGSYGKSQGIGLGLTDAREHLFAVGGSLDIDSWKSRGTIVRLILPFAANPAWYKGHLDIVSTDNILILDDDHSVHYLWRNRFEGRRIQSIYDPEDFDPSLYPSDHWFYIFDYEILGNMMTGLDLIRVHNLGDKAVLVTSYYNDPKIQTAIAQCGSQLLPKFMISTVAIIDSSATTTGNTLPNKATLPLSTESSVPQLVLIDNDDLIHSLWQYVARQKGLKLLCVRSYEELLELTIDTLPKSVPIFIDKNLDNSVDGLEVARTLYSKGFDKLYLATGDDLTLNHNSMVYLKGILSKDFPSDEFLV
jgi:signal transduction histidine kinase